jgi:hypothetical protein
MTSKTKRALNAPADMSSEIQLVMVTHDDNLVFEDNNMAPLEQLEYFERFAQTRLALQEVTPDSHVDSRRAMGAFIHEASLRYIH